MAETTEATEQAATEDQATETHARAGKGCPQNRGNAAQRPSRRTRWEAARTLSNRPRGRS
jgi:hypothetical protein